MHCIWYVYLLLICSHVERHKLDTCPVVKGQSMVNESISNFRLLQSLIAGHDVVSSLHHFVVRLN